MKETLPITDDLSIICDDAELVISVKGTQAILSLAQARLLATVLRGLTHTR